MGAGQYLAKNLRAADREEVEIATGQCAEVALLNACETSHRTAVALADGVPFAIFGLCRHSDEIGVPWLLGTDDMVKHQRVLLEHARDFVYSMQRRYPKLVNMTHARNTVALRWLRRLGFQLGPEIMHNNHPFIPFIRQQ